MRSTTRTNVDPVEAVIQAALDNADSGELARNIVSVLDLPNRVCSSVIYSLESDGRLRLVDGFGFSHRVTESFSHLDLFDDLPITRAIRHSTASALPIETVTDNWPQLAEYDLPHSGFLVLPCHSLGVSTGGMILGIAAPHPLPALEPTLEATLRLVGSWSIVMSDRRADAQ